MRNISFSIWVLRILKLNEVCQNSCSTRKTHMCLQKSCTHFSDILSVLTEKNGIFSAFMHLWALEFMSPPLYPTNPYTVVNMAGSGRGGKYRLLWKRLVYFKLNRSSKSWLLVQLCFTLAVWFWTSHFTITIWGETVEEQVTAFTALICIHRSGSR